MASRPHAPARPKPAPTPELLAMVARRFRVLADPARLGILHALQAGERTVTELVDVTGLLQGTLSKHLQTLHDAAFVRRRREGQFVYYALADDDVLALCEHMCGRIEVEADAARQLLRRR
ncbi:MAG TPA: metalloregulator ArsR/SmtB family transcription factor [Gemmatimonadaceae bacterium]|nr:metalloregulator ArsR/SmtB family transcription factor [Gemmatimonadaceae bacterium]